MKIEEAFRRYKAARNQLTAATQRSFPVGRTVAVTLGRARIIGRITNVGDGQWPANVTIINLRTGKQRRFSATGHGHDPVLCGV